MHWRAVAAMTANREDDKRHLYTTNDHPPVRIPYRGMDFFEF